MDRGEGRPAQAPGAHGHSAWVGSMFPEASLEVGDRHSFSSQWGMGETPPCLHLPFAKRLQPPFPAARKLPKRRFVIAQGGGGIGTKHESGGRKDSLVVTSQGLKWRASQSAP